jgi:serine/threonine protein kinase
MDDFFKWKQLKHNHILPVYGITYGFGLVPAIVSPWMHNGSLSAYLDKHHNDITVTQRFALVSPASNKSHNSSRLLLQLADVAAGLQYRTLCHLEMHEVS